MQLTHVLAKVLNLKLRSKPSPPGISVQRPAAAAAVDADASNGCNI
jgi:hypothetical protein